MPKINEVVLKNGRKIRIWSDKGMTKSKKRLVGKQLAGRYFYLYDKDGDRISESEKEFTECEQRHC